MHPNDSSGHFSGPLTNNNWSYTRKRPAVLAACNPCRARKNRCDGERPACMRCSERQIECNYATQDPIESRTAALKRENENLKNTINGLELAFENLKGMTEEKAMNVLRTVNAAADPLSTFSAIVDNNIPRPKSVQDITLRTSLPQPAGLRRELVIGSPPRAKPEQAIDRDTESGRHWRPW